MTELNEKEAHLKELHNQHFKIDEEIRKLHNELRQLRLKRLLETDLLGKVEWVYSYGFGVRGQEIDGFSQLLEPRFRNDRFEADGWTLSFDGDELGISFESATIMNEFIKNHKMKVNFHGLKSEVKQKEAEYNKIKALAESLGVLGE